MTVQAFIVLTPAQATASRLLNDDDYGVAPQAVVNVLANNLGFGVLVGTYVLPARILNDPGYAAWLPSLGGLPIHVMDSETLFAWVDPNN